MNARPIRLGSLNGRPVFLDPDDRNKHFFIVGATGSGKSNAMTHMAMQDLITGNSVITVDPHGEEYRRLLRWMTAMNMGHKKANLFDLTSGTLTGFNPLAVQSRNPDHIAAVSGRLVDAVSVVFNQATSDTPRLQRVLGIAFYAAIWHGLTLADVPDMLATSDVSKDGSILMLRVGDTFIQGQLAEFDNLRRRNVRAYMDTIESTYNRLVLFLKNQRLRTIFSQTTNTLDVRGIMDRGESLLCNIATNDPISGHAVVDDDEARLVGVLLVNEIFQAGQSRPPGSRHVMVYLDEMPLYINRRIGRILQESRKRNLCLHLACQHLHQLKELDEGIFHSVMNNTQNKLIFRIGTRADAEYLARESFNYDLKQVKHTLPHVVGYEITILKNVSVGKSIGKSTGTNWSDTTGKTLTVGGSTTHGTSESEGTAIGTNKSKSVGSGGGRESGTSALTSSSESLRDPEQAAAFREDEEVIPRFNEAVPLVTNATSEGTNESERENWNETETEGDSLTRSEERTTSSSYTASLSRAKSQQRSEGGSTSVDKGRSKTESKSEAITPIIKDMPVQLWSQEEVQYMFGTLLKDLRPGQGVLKTVGEDADIIEIDEVLSYSHVKPEQLQKRLQSIHDRQESIIRLPSPDELRDLSNGLFGPPALGKTRPGGEGQVLDEPEGW